MGGEQIFQVVPAAVKTWWITVFFVGLAVFLLAVMVFVRQMVENVSKASFAVDGQALEIRAWPYGRAIPLGDLDLEKARIADPATDPEARLSWKRNGVNLGALRAGWWKLKAGGKALVFLTAPGKAVYLPTRQGYVLMATVSDPQGFLDALRHRAR